jgi:hypothetical protein
VGIGDVNDRELDWGWFGHFDEVYKDSYRLEA